MNQLKKNPLNSQVAQESIEQISGNSIYLDRTKRKKRKCQQGMQHVLQVSHRTRKRPNLCNMNSTKGCMLELTYKTNGSNHTHPSTKIVNQNSKLVLHVYRDMQRKTHLFYTE